MFSRFLTEIQRAQSEQLIQNVSRGCFDEINGDKMRICVTILLANNDDAFATGNATPSQFALGLYANSVN